MKDVYVDTLIQPGRQQNEHKALIDMVDRSHTKDKVIIIADRNYESYNDFAHIEISHLTKLKSFMLCVGA